MHDGTFDSGGRRTNGSISALKKARKKKDIREKMIAQPEIKKSLIAVDLGAQSCRVSLLRLADDEPSMHVVHRFSNAPINLNGTLRWDIARIFDGVKEGLRLCAAAAPEGVASIGIDGWGVDYARLADDGSLLRAPFCHRDERTIAAMEKLLQRISAERLYALTGIQLLSLNTLFQLYADNLDGIPPQAEWLNLPEYVTHLLGGRAVSEFTMATHTQMVALGTHSWCEDIFREAGLSRSAAPDIVPTGTFVGNLKGELSELAAFRDTKLIVPACHDTASAIAAIPAAGDDCAFISSGTWSLVGTVLPSPCVGEEARRMNFTNLGGVGGAICFLKNVNGLWILRQCLDEWENAGHKWTAEELVRRCEQLPEPAALLDVDAAELLTPGEMPWKINAQLEKRGQRRLVETGEDNAQMANVIFHSLAQRYAEVLISVGTITQKKLKRVFIVGGGSKNQFVNRLTERYSGLKVIAGSSEATTIGNFAIQIASLMGEANEDRGGVSAAAVARYAEGLSAQSLAS
jgi:rhamnulokinase